MSQSTCSLEPKLDPFPSAGKIIITLAVAWYFAGWLIALVNYIEREPLPHIVALIKERLVPIVQRHIFNRLTEFRQSTKIHRLCAVHESGHVVIYLHLCPNWVRGVRADGFTWIDNTGGITHLMPHNDIMIEQDYLDLIASYYGGLVTEFLVLGTHSDGCSSDLTHAAMTANNAHSLFAGGHHATPIDYAKLGKLGHKSEQIDHQRMAAVVQLLKQGHERALSILTEERALLDAITEALLQKGQLNRAELLALHATHASKKP